VHGTARVERRVALLLPRLRPGDVAVLDVLDLDRPTAQALADARVAAVVDASDLISGRYPNLGPEVLAEAGVVLVDGIGAEGLAAIKDGTSVRVHEGDVYVGERAVASGRVLDRTRIETALGAARRGMISQLQSFTHNSSEFLRREQDLLLHGQGVPDLRTRINGRPVVIVVRGYDYREDLRKLRRYIREQNPVLIGVDGGADALLEAHQRPDVVVVGEQGLGSGSTNAGEQAQKISDRALREAHEVVVHADRSGRAMGADRLDRIGVRTQKISASGTSEDVAMLLADASGASLIIAVGTHATLDEFLDRQRSGLASTFLTRLRVGPKLVDAKGVHQLYAGRVRLWHLALVLLAGLVALGIAIAATPVGGGWWDDLQAALSDLFDWIQGLFT
jgi:uncharacterized membrane-anchored protein